MTPETIAMMFAIRPVELNEVEKSKWMLFFKKDLHLKMENADTEKSRNMDWNHLSSGFQHHYRTRQFLPVRSCKNAGASAALFAGRSILRACCTRLLGLVASASFALGFRDLVATGAGLDGGIG